MTAESTTTSDEAQIRELIEARVKAVHAKDVGALIPNVAPDIVSFNVTNPLHNDGVEALRKGSEEWFASYDGPIGYQIRDLRITAGDEVAFCHFYYHVSGTLTDGSSVNMWVRATACYRKLDGTWMATHMHESVPFDPQSGQASLDLEP